MAVKSKSGTIHFVVAETGESVARCVVDGRAVTTTTNTVIVSPPEVTREELVEYVRSIATQDEDDGEWSAEDDNVIGTVNTYDDDFECLVDEVAARLNEVGVSISDWTPYCLD